MSCLLAGNRDILFPKLTDALRLTRFSDIGVRFLEQLGYEPYQCESEEEARSRAMELIAKRRWPCYFFRSDTTGEKDFEEFFTDRETLDMDRFQTLAAIKNEANFEHVKLDAFLREVGIMRERRTWVKADIVRLFNEMIPEFNHFETGKYLDGRM
jgi:hypothetical protein